MFADPITASFAGSPVSLPRISIKDQSSVYKSADGKFTIRVSHQNTKTRTRRLIRFEDYDSGYTNNLVGVTQIPGVHAYLVIDEPLTSVFTDNNGATEFLAADLIAWLTANTNANLAKVLGSEI